ncbi:MAG: S1 RNA-binding domain-containing protein, partial [Chloroflexi bacterium]|nr:S1 RNA-binding domain-containing protein [Chloroflexota bacterium]
SELSWRRVQHPAEVLTPGDEVDVYVLNVDRERQRIGLSLRRLQPEPWTAAAERYQAGQVVEATITRLTDFGAFALVDEELEGLIHISELASYHVQHPQQVVNEGDVVQVCILRIDPERRRLGLSLKQAAEACGDVDWVVDDADQEEPFDGESGEPPDWELACEESLADRGDEVALEATETEE